MSSDKIVTDQLQNALAETIKSFTSSIQQVGSKTVDFAKEQIPDVIHQYITWGFTHCLLWAVLALFCIFFFVWGANKIVASVTEKEKNEVRGFVYGLGLIWYGPWFIVFCFQFFEAVQIYVAPKVWLIQQAAHLIK